MFFIYYSINVLKLIFFLKNDLLYVSEPSDIGLTIGNKIKFIKKIIFIKIKIQANNKSSSQNRE